jgi:hypothetical protein
MPKEEVQRMLQAEPIPEQISISASRIVAVPQEAIIQCKVSRAA